MGKEKSHWFKRKEGKLFGENKARCLYQINEFKVLCLGIDLSPCTKKTKQEFSDGLSKKKLLAMNYLATTYSQMFKMMQAVKVDLQ